MSKNSRGRFVVGALSGLALTALSIPAFAQGLPPIAHDPMEGASCTTPSDCGGKLNCVGQKCVAPGASTPPPAGNGAPGNGAPGNGAPGNGNGAPSNGWSGGGPSGSSSSSDSGSKSSKGFEGVRGFAGITFGGGPSYLGSSILHTTQSGLLFGLKGGVLIDHAELGAEISPVTFVPFLSVSGTKPNLQANIYGGYHIPITKVAGLGEICWPLRAGIGLYSVNTNGNTLFQARADLIGLSTIVGPVLLDLHVPSFRFIADNTGYIMHFMFGFGGAFLPDAVF